MNKRVLFLCSLVVLNFNNSLHAQGTAFTYQGKLNNNGAPATGSYDLSFTIYDAASSGNVIAGPLTNAATAVSNGLFTVQLDFGPGVFNGNARWIGIAVRTYGTGTFSILSPRQDVTSTPYAIQSANAQTAATASAVTGPISLSQLPGVVLTNGGNIVGNGAGLSNVNALTFSGLTTNQFVITRSSLWRSRRTSIRLTAFTP